VSGKRNAVLQVLPKIATGIPGFDELSHGGLPRYRTSLLKGGPGSGKTVFALQSLVNAVRRRLGLTYWSLSQWAKLKVKNAVNYIGEFETALASEAARHHADGVICGHIHHAAIHERFAVHYVNCGDWVESCTAIAEHADGGFEILTWTSEFAGVDEPAPVAAARAA